MCYRWLVCDRFGFNWRFCMWLLGVCCWCFGRFWVLWFVYYVVVLWIGMWLRWYLICRGFCVEWMMWLCWGICCVFGWCNFLVIFGWGSNWVGWCWCCRLGWIFEFGMFGWYWCFLIFCSRFWVWLWLYLNNRVKW